MYEKKIKLQGKKDMNNTQIYNLENKSYLLQNKINELINESLNL